MPARVAIIGAGMTGLACAEALAARGITARLFDKGRAAGGRMATRRLATSAGEASFDHGAQFFTAREPAFAARVARWAAAGIVAPWPAAGHEAFVGSPGMNAPLRDMASRLEVLWYSEVTAISRGTQGWHLQGAGVDEGDFEALVLAIPAEQAARLLAPVDTPMAALAEATPSQPCWTLMASFDTPLAFANDSMRDAGTIGWAARNSAKPGRNGPESWVIQASPAWSAAHIELPGEQVASLLLDALAACSPVSLPKPIAASAHRWRYARSGGNGEAALWNAELQLGVCGDWLLGPRVECAWESGTRLAGMLTVAP